MLSFKLKNTQIGFSFSFFAVIALVSIIQGTNYFLFALCACLIHEMGHIIMMFLFGVAPSKIVFYGGGIKITPDNKKISSVTQDFLILTAGIAVNMIVFISLYFVHSDNMALSLFAVFNLIIALFNLLPFKYFDGGKIIDLIVSSKAPRQIIGIKKAVRIVSVFSLVAFAIVYAIYKGINISLYFTLVYILISEIML